MHNKSKINPPIITSVKISAVSTYEYISDHKWEMTDSPRRREVHAFWDQESSYSLPPLHCSVNGVSVWVHKSPKQARLQNIENIQISSKDQIETIGEPHSLQRASGCPHGPCFGSTLLFRASWKCVSTGHSVLHWSLLFHQSLLKCSAAQS